MRKAALKTAPTAAAAERLTTISTFGSPDTLITQAPLVAHDTSEPMVMIFLPLAAPTTAAPLAGQRPRAGAEAAADGGHDGVLFGHGGGLRRIEDNAHHDLARGTILKE